MDEFDFKNDSFPVAKDDKMSDNDDSPNAKEPAVGFDLLGGFEPTPATSPQQQPTADSLLHHDNDEDLLSGSHVVSSTNRPLVTPAVAEDKDNNKSGNNNIIAGFGDNNLLFDDKADEDDASYTLPTSSNKKAEESFANVEPPAPGPLGDDTVSIEGSSTTGFHPGGAVAAGSVRDDSASLLLHDDDVTTGLLLDEKKEEECEDLLPKHPKIDTEKTQENTTGIIIKKTSPPPSACDDDVPFAHPATNDDDSKVKQHSSAAAMEAEPSTAAKTDDGSCCCFSPGAWFNPEKLHPCVAELMYWRDLKKSGAVFGVVLVLLLCLKYFSCISVAAHATTICLVFTMSFRIYKNVLQAVQKSNEGHPFKEYLDVNIDLSHEKLKDVSEVVIHHVNSFTNKMRSLILVEDLFDTFKLLLFAWCMTYVGAVLNGMTVIILAFVSAFTLPKVYETNKTQIDAYAEVIRTKGKEVMEMVNSKIPLGKKKKEE